MKNFIKLGLLALIVVLGIWFYKSYVRTPQNQQEKVLGILANYQIRGFDPAIIDDVYTSIEITKVYEGLLDYNYLKRPFELVPNLAAGLPTISADGQVYTFRLKPGVKFQDNPCFAQGKGRELVAEDFVYSIKRVADPQVQSPVFSWLADKIQGLDAWRNKYTDGVQADYTEAIAGLKALDKYTLQLTLNKPWPQLPYILAMGFCYAVPREAVEHYGQEFLNHPVGTGPFMLKEFKPQLNKLVYHKNPTFRDKYFPSEASEAYQHMLADAGKKLPLVDKIITHIVPEEQPRWLKFQQGAVDIIDMSRDNNAVTVVQNNSLAPQWQQKGIQLFLEPEQGVNFFAINNGHKLFKNNVKLRQALSLAYDRQRAVELFGQGISVPAQSIVPPGLAGYQKDYINPYTTYDLAQAEQLLAEAGYPAGKGLPVIVFDTDSSTRSRHIGAFFQKCMEKIGVKIKLETNIYPELLRKMAQKKTMIHALYWSGDYPDAESFLQLLYKSDQSVGMGANFNDPVYNALYEKAAVMQPSPERTALYEQLNQLAAAKVPAIYTVYPYHPVLYHGWVKNYLWSDFHYGTEQYFNIDLEEKQALQAKF